MSRPRLSPKRRGIIMPVVKLDDHRLYYKHCQSAWTSDDRGIHEWYLGWSVYATEPDPFPIPDSAPHKPFSIFEDDGRGNGTYVGDFDTLEAASREVDRLVAQADERGF